MVALSGTLLVVHQICAAGHAFGCISNLCSRVSVQHDIILFSRGDSCIFPK